MKISMRKLKAITKFKFKELLKNKTFLTSSLVIIGMTVVFKYIYINLISENNVSVNVASGMALDIGITLSMCMLTLMIPATLLAKDKEKNTLRTLMTSSVNAVEYFLGSMIPVIVIGFLINILILFISEMPLTVINLPLFLLIILIGNITSCVLGMMIGLFSKNQMAASNLITPVMLVVMLIPMLSKMIEGLQNISKFIYSGIISNMISAYTMEESYSLNLQSLIVLIGQIIVVIILFVILFKKNGFEKD
jgi:ABC-2 type transporter.